MKTRIISGFPGVGKSHMFNNQSEHGLIMLDSDSSEFSWISPGVRNPEFPQNYIHHIKDNIGKVDVIFISSHKVVRDALRENNVDYSIVFPNVSEKERYLERYRVRGNDDKFIEFISKNWESFLAEIRDDDYPLHFELPIGDHYLNIVLDGSYQKIMFQTLFTLIPTTPITSEQDKYLQDFLFKHAQNQVHKLYKSDFIVIVHGEMCYIMKNKWSKNVAIPKENLPEILKFVHNPIVLVASE